MPPNYQDSLDYLYSLQVFGVKLGLDNIRQLLQRVGNPQESLRIVHIAGTNGKGSTAAALASIFHTANIRAGLYTSPHLHDFTERIRIDTKQISAAEAVELIEELRPHVEELRATYFEVTTAMALLSFQRHELEWVVLETGLGGRLDATNAVTPELCVITPIDLDHTAFLGTELAQVAAEKAGIFKAKVPVVSAPQQEEVMAVLQQQAVAVGTSLVQLGEDYFWRQTGKTFSVSGSDFCLDKITPTICGEHQQQNLALAAVAADCLRQSGVDLSLADIKAGLEKVCWPGRLEWLPEQILLDGAHNPAGAKILAHYLRQQDLSGVHLVVGCKADKQAAELLGELLPFAACVYVTQPPFHPAVPVDILMQEVESSGGTGFAYPEPVDAIKAALDNRQSGETILVAGSLFLVASIREFLLLNTNTVTIVN